MIKGVKNWKDRSIRYSQNTNATEAIIKRVLKENDLPATWQHLEFCGPSAFCTILEGLGLITADDYPEVNGVRIQLDDFIGIHLNDPKYDQGQYN